VTVQTYAIDIPDNALDYIVGVLLQPAHAWCIDVVRQINAQHVPDEPQGVGAVVSTEDCVFVRTDEDPEHPWVKKCDGAPTSERFDWAYVIAQTGPIASHSAGVQLVGP
jgi:hypothetical protein